MNLDGQHWYLQDGTPFYEVAAKDGQLRPVTLRDARKVHAVPSVTAVLSIIARPGLESWKVKQGIYAALTLPRQPDELEDQWLARVSQDAKQEAAQAAELGSRIHDSLEKHRDGVAQVPYLATALAVEAEIDRLFPGVTDWVTEKSFAHPDGFGGRVDLHSPSTGIVIDYKGKDGDFTDGKSLTYDQHWQLAAYQHGLGLSRAPCVNLFFSRTHPGAVVSHVWSEAEVAEGETVFMAALRLWQSIKKYYPSAPELKRERPDLHRWAPARAA